MHHVETQFSVQKIGVQHEQAIYTQGELCLRRRQRLRQKLRRVCGKRIQGLLHNLPALQHQANVAHTVGF